MLKIKFIKRNNRLTLKMDGHASFRDYGEDIVCASASMLLYTIAQVVKDNKEMLTRLPDINIKSGCAKVTSHPKEDYYGTIEGSYEVVATGLNLLAHNYPDNVSFERIESST